MRKRIEKILKAAGRKLMQYYGKLEQKDIQFKAPIDLVTKADKETESFLRSQLHKHFPDIGFIGEEEGFKGRDTENVFIADPLDGTTNFVHTYPFFAISLAYKKNNITRLGFVYLPYFKTLYFAEKGKGAFKNNRPISVSKTSSLIESLVVTGFACVRGNLQHDNVPIFSKVIYKTQGVRRDGAAAVDLCLVAEGVFDIFWEMNLNPWDVAAGALIVQEAGGYVSDFGNTLNFEKNRQIVASNSILHKNFLELLQQGKDRKESEG